MISIKALIVEDDEEWQSIIQDELISYNCDVDMAGSYEAAIQKLRGKGYDLVTLDMALSPKEESWQVKKSHGWRLLVNQLRNVFPGPAIFVISGSFGTQPQRVHEMDAAYGIHGFMDKDEFEPETLQTWVKNVRTLKEIGGTLDLTSRDLLNSNRPEASAREVRSLYERQSAIMRKETVRTKVQEEMRSIYKDVLAILQRNKAEAELQKAQYGLLVPTEVMNSIHKFEHEIERIETEIARLTEEA